MKDTEIDELAEALAVRLVGKLTTKTGPIKWSDLDRQLARAVCAEATPEHPEKQAVLRRIRWTRK